MRTTRTSFTEVGTSLTSHTLRCREADGGKGNEQASTTEDYVSVYDLVVKVFDTHTGHDYILRFRQFDLPQITPV